MKLSIIIPAHNEENTIITIIEEVLTVKLQDSINKQIIVIDDGSTDTTTEKLKNLEPDPYIEIIYCKESRGKTAAVKLGIERATGDFIIIQDADLEYSPSHFPKLLEPILKQKAEVVYGSRFMGKAEDMTFVNWVANKISNITINMLYGSKLTDFHTCYKLFKKDVIKNIKIESRNFSFDTEVTVRLIKANIDIYEEPIDYIARKRSEGKKITWSKALETYFVLIKFKFIK